ncbi:MAG TPA: VCBS repeat-containing protein [Bryobacteraceae bacterium]|nr:VCBS repeat-containing protein [Bryobacteraceae bacterium]
MTTDGLSRIARSLVILLALAAAACAQFTAAPGSPFTVGTKPMSVAVGDFNGDGKPDLAIANGDGTVTVLLGNGSGGFAAAPGSPFPAGSGPSSVAVGDFNGDGKPDLAIADYNGNNVTVLLGDGTGRFTAAPSSPFPAGSQPNSVAAGDFNGDGKLDLAIANYNSNNVTVLLGDGQGGFTAAPGSPFPAGTQPYSVAVGDFSGDGKPDLAIANIASGNVTVLLGNGAGGFAAAPNSPFAVGSYPESVVAADFNADGKLDIAVAGVGLYSATGSNVTVLLGDGTGGFTAVQSGPAATGDSPTALATADFNEDGLPDLAVINPETGTIAVLLGNGTGGFTSATGSPFTAGTQPVSLAAGDFNVDGKPDFAVVNYGSNNLTVLLNGSTPPLKLLSPVNGTTGLSVTPTLSWNAQAGATSYDVHFGTSSPPPLVTTTTATTYAPSALAPGTLYYWQVVAHTGATTLSSPVWSFMTQVPPPPAPALSLPANGATGVLVAPTLVWTPSAGATSYDVSFGTSASPSVVATTSGTSYSPGTLNPATTYYWQIAAKNGAGSAASATWSFTTGTPAAGLHFIPVAPCRVADTRNPSGPFGGPSMTAASTRSFTIPGACGIPATAQAYSLNVTVVPAGPLSFLTLWPAGQTRPLVSTLNSFGGTVVANAAIVPAGAAGAVSVYATDPTDVILDIDGYFDATTAANSISFYPATPCRVADTRGAAGLFGGPSLVGGQSRDFAIPSAGCSIPVTAQAFSLNVTALPLTGYLGYLTTWPSGQTKPPVSTLNSWTGKVVANAAIVPAGSNESISVFVSDSANAILDINGYFGQPGNPGALSFYPVAPCRVADTRNAAGPFGGPKLDARATRSFAIPAGVCNIPTTAAAYSMNVTVVPDGLLSYLTAWPTGSSQPGVSTLNSFDGAVVANAAIVPAGASGAVSIFVTNPTQVILDIDGYFAP